MASFLNYPIKFRDKSIVIVYVAQQISMRNLRSLSYSRNNCGNTCVTMLLCRKPSGNACTAR